MSAHRHDHDHAAHGQGARAGHGHDHGHGGQGHSHAPRDFGRAFAIGISLNVAFVLLEAAAGVVTGSLALLADAGHNLSDVFGLLLAWTASTLAKRRPTQRRTYGMGRSTVLAALANAVVLLVAVGGILIEAVRRIESPEPIAAGIVIAVAAAGIVVNGGTALLFFSGQREDLNVRGAYLHMAADAAISLGVVLAALAIMATGWSWLDPAIAVAIALVIAIGTWGLLRESLDLALDAVPAGVDPAAVQAYLAGLPGVADVHDLHIWAMSTTEVALTAHLVRPGASVDDAFLDATARALETRFGICHATIQVEAGAEACRLAPSEVV